MRSRDLLKGAKVKIDNLSKYLSKSGVIVKPHIGRSRKKFCLPKELLGDNTKEDDEFFNDYINQGNINFLPKSDENDLTEIAVRNKVKKVAIACDGTFMTADVYNQEFMPFYEEKRKEYFKKRDEIAKKWDVLVAAFFTKLEAYLSTRNISDTQAISIINIMKASIPSKEEFKNSFYMELELSSFPVEANVDMFSDEVAKQVKKSITETKVLVVKEMLSNLMISVFDRMNTFIAYYNTNGVLKYQQMKPVMKLRDDLVKNNLLDHPLINRLVDDLSKMVKMPLDTDNEIDSVVEQAEIVLVNSYGFLADCGLLDNLDMSKCVMSEMDISNLYLAINPNSVVARNVVTGA